MVELPPEWEYLNHVKGWLTFKEAVALAEMARGLTVLEIGSYRGRSTLALASTAKEVHAVDWGRGDTGCGDDWTTPELLENLHRRGVTNVVVHVGFSEDVVPSFKRVFDMAFIDGSHTAESVEKDVGMVLECLKPGGMIAFHDWDYDPVRLTACKMLGWEDCVAVVDRLHAGRIDGEGSKVKVNRLARAAALALKHGPIGPDDLNGKTDKLERMRAELNDPPDGGVEPVNELELLGRLYLKSENDDLKLAQVKNRLETAERAVDHFKDASLGKEKERQETVKVLNAVLQTFKGVLDGDVNPRRVRIAETAPGDYSFDLLDRVPAVEPETNGVHEEQLVS